MEIQYRNLLKDWNLTLSSDVLDPAFVQKATEFETKIKNNELSDEEIKAWDDELVKLFNELHNFSEEESPEVKAANHKKDIAEAKNEIAEAETIEALTALQQKFAHLPELAPFIEKRIEKLQLAQKTAEQNKFISDAKEVIANTPYDNLPLLLEQPFKDHPELVKIIEARIEKEKPAPPEPETIRDKLQKARKREWSYQDLKDIGINPTGDDMTVEGVFLERQYLYKIYKITKVDGKKI
jgi:hypothetical protein